MPDPKLATPVKAVPRGTGWLVVDANGVKVKGGGPFVSKEVAERIAARVNDAWERAKAERRSKGAPEVTQEAAFDERLHLRDRRGRFTLTGRDLGHLRTALSDVRDHSRTSRALEDRLAQAKPGQHSFSHHEMGLLQDFLYDQVDSSGGEPPAIYDRLGSMRRRIEKAAAGKQSPSTGRESLGDSIQRNLAIMPVSKDADSETKATHRALREKFGMNPDIHAPGDPSWGKGKKPRK